MPAHPYTFSVYTGAHSTWMVTELVHPVASPTGHRFKVQGAWARNKSVCMGVYVHMWATSMDLEEGDVRGL